MSLNKIHFDSNHLPEFKELNQRIINRIMSNILPPSVQDLLAEDGRVRNLEKINKWRPVDDLSLKEAVERGLSASQIAKSITTLNRFTKEEIEKRWHTLLYDDKESRSATESILILMKMKKKEPWSQEEENIIIQQLISYGYLASELVLGEYKDIFHPSRTVKSLEAHFYSMKLSGRFNRILHFHHSVFEWEQLRSMYISQAKEAGVNIIIDHSLPTPQLDLSSNKRKRENDINQIKKRKLLNSNLKPFTIFSSTENSIIEPTQYEEHENLFNIIQLENCITNQFPDAYAIFENDRISFPITKFETIFGRQTENFQIADYDVSLLHPESKQFISRKQATVNIKVSKKDSTVYFTIKNTGKKPIFVNERRIERNFSSKLVTNTFVVFPGNISFRVIINTSKFEEIKQLIQSRHKE